MQVTFTPGNQNFSPLIESIIESSPRSSPRSSPESRVQVL